MLEDFSAKTGKKEYEVGKGKPPKGHRWIKGQSGNPKGKPKGSLSITARIKAELQKKTGQNKKTYLKELIEQILIKAIKEGNEQMIKTIWNYVDGLPKQSIEHSGEISLPVPLLKNLKK